MKKLNFKWIFIIIFFIISCQQEQIGQYPIDEIAPQKVANPVVQNLKGKAIITYNLPEDDDLLYVKALYKLPNGKEKEVIASSFINSIIITGFAKSTKSVVQLISVDRSQNESEPVIVEVEPLDSPIFDIHESLKVQAAFGGMKLSWKNPVKEDIVISVISLNEYNEYETLETFYTTVAEGDDAVRGLEPKEREFGIFIRDIYSNYTDTLFTTLTPWEEQELNKKLFIEKPKCNLFPYSSWAPKTTSVLWDGITTSNNNASLLAFSLAPVGIDLFVTLDFGVTAKLSRFKYWQRDGFYFNLNNPRLFEIWGTNDPGVVNASACDWDGWEFLVACESWKPSGPDVVSEDKLTSEDLARARAGEEFEFPLDIPPVRYVRFRQKVNWSGGTTGMQICELTWWGQVIK